MYFHLERIWKELERIKGLVEVFLVNESRFVRYVIMRMWLLFFNKTWTILRENYVLILCVTNKRSVIKVAVIKDDDKFNNLINR